VNNNNAAAAYLRAGLSLYPYSTPPNYPLNLTFNPAAAAAVNNSNPAVAAAANLNNQLKAFNSNNNNQQAFYAQFSDLSLGSSHNNSKDVRGPEGANLFVYNIPEGYTEADLNSLFGNFGRVISSRVQRDISTGVSKGFGFVSFSDPSSAATAIAALDGFNIHNKRLTVRLKTVNNNDNNYNNYNNYNNNYNKNSLALHTSLAPHLLAQQI
jgi:RNA recognition motif-containing protein